jgi:hypothetical protein
MEIHKSEKNLIFYTPGQSGIVFTYLAGHAVDTQMINEAIEHLEYETECKVTCVEERRAMSRGL